MKKVVSMALAVAMVASLAACGGKSSAPAATQAAPAATQAAAPAETKADAPAATEAAAPAIAAQTIKLTQPQPEGTPEDHACLKLKETVEELSGGAITVEYYPAGQIGSIPESIQSVQMGITQVAMGPCAIIGSYCEDIALLDLPYLLPRDQDVIFEVMNNEVGREFLDRLDDVGIHALGFWFAGFRQMTCTHDINGLADMKGTKMRIMESNILTDTYNALGAQPIVVAYAETYNALANGTVDAQENPAQSTASMKFYEVQKYIVDTYHDAQVHCLMTNKAWFDAQTPEVQEIMIEAEKAARKVLQDELPGYTKDCIDEMTAAGCEYHVLSDEGLAEFQEATKTVYDKYLSTDWRKDYLPRLQQAFADGMAKKG